MQVIQFLFQPELLELPLKVNDGLLDPLLALIPCLLAVLLFELFISIPATSSTTNSLLLLNHLDNGIGQIRLLLLNPVDLVLQVNEAVFQALYHLVLVPQLVLHHLEDLILLHIDLLFGLGGLSLVAAGLCGTFLHQLNQGVVHQRGRLHNDTSVEVRNKMLFL